VPPAVLSSGSCAISVCSAAFPTSRESSLIKVKYVPLEASSKVSLQAAFKEAERSTPLASRNFGLVTYSRHARSQPSC
jgi:hypothetical protein